MFVITGITAEHRPPRGTGVKRDNPPSEEQALIEAVPEIAAYLTDLSCQ